MIRVATDIAAPKRSSETMKAPVFILLSLVLALGVAGCERHGGFRGFGGGERGGGGHGLRRECRAELEQYCAASQRGRERIQCLQGHSDKLSAGCKQALDERLSRRGGGRKRDRAGDKANDDND